jgi:hypothetical protein
MMWIDRLKKEGHWGSGFPDYLNPVLDSAIVTRLLALLIVTVFPFVSRDLRSRPNLRDRHFSENLDNAKQCDER